MKQHILGGIVNHIILKSIKKLFIYLYIVHIFIYIYKYRILRRKCGFLCLEAMRTKIQTKYERKETIITNYERNR